MTARSIRVAVYAKGLLNALPEREFIPIPGMPPELGALPDGCAFADRCAYADARCTGERPAFTAGLACHHAPTGRAASPSKESADA
ncbi:ABC transporter ATP-binding protein [Streptomyces badius]